MLSGFGRVLRLTGSALDAIGLTIQGRYAPAERLSSHRRLLPIYNQHPVLGDNLFIAPSATIVGKAEVGNGTTVWYGVVVRSDAGNVTIGQNTSIGERCMIHVPSSATDSRKTIIGNHVYLGSGCIANGCTIEDGAFVSPGSSVLDGAVIGSTSKLAPGSVVLPGTKIPAGQLWAGNPAKYERDLTPEEIKELQTYTTRTLELSEKHTYWHELTHQERAHLKNTEEKKKTIYLPERLF